MGKDKTPLFFETQAHFRAWLAENHETAEELYVGYFKVGSGKPSITWSQSVDEALCFGWIDGLRKSIDAESYFIRFTPRKPGSIWSAVNIEKMETLMQQGLVKPMGLAAYARRKDEKSKIYSYEKAEVALPDAFLEKLKANEKAWAWFEAMPLSYRRPAINWVASAKQEATRLRRLQQLIEDSAAGRKIKPLSY